MKEKNEGENFWHIRSDYYDKLFWTKDKNYLDAIMECADLNEKQLVLDVGTGTGDVANRVKEHVRHVVAIDISDSMLSKGKWSGISIVKWDIANALFTKGLFDRVLARMVFHHILDNLDRAILRCFDLLKDDGQIVIAEGVPPSEDSDVVAWYTEMFKYKETRRTFTITELEYYLKKNGFKDIKTHIYVMEDFNVRNWLENSGLPKKRQSLIYQMHMDADQKIKDVYNMRMIKGDCVIRTVNVIVSGKK